MLLTLNASSHVPHDPKVSQFVAVDIKCVITLHMKLTRVQMNLVCKTARK